ncbi:MAG: 1,2-phenylacetyl-CoA epoxidase subunit PaaD [Steroidobacter sp.]
MSYSIESTESSAARVERDVWRLLAEVPDPEIPVLSVVELGLIRYVRSDEAQRVAVGVSPTYTGCPATEVIQSAIRSRLETAGYDEISIDSVLSPPWTSDWLTESAREKLKEYGIAPPAHAVSHPRHVFREPEVQCPRCDSPRSQLVSEFGSTPCKALYRCSACLEPFEYFKCI